MCKMKVLHQDHNPGRVRILTNAFQYKDFNLRGKPCFFRVLISNVIIVIPQ